MVTRLKLTFVSFQSCQDHATALARQRSLGNEGNVKEEEEEEGRGEDGRVFVMADGTAEFCPRSIVQEAIKNQFELLYRSSRPSFLHSKQ